jgi:hypothetical protein
MQTAKRWLGILCAAAVITLCLQPTATAQFVQRVIHLADGLGNRITSSTEGSLQPLHVLLVNPATDAAAVFGATATHGGTIAADGTQNMVEAASDFSGNTAVSDGQPVRLVADLLGRVLTAGPCDRAARVGGTPVTITDGSSTSAISAGGSGIYLEIWDVIAKSNSSSDTSIDIRDGTGGSVMATIPVPATTDTIGGAVVNFSVPKTGSANTAIAIDPADAVSVTVTLSGCKAK